MELTIKESFTVIELLHLVLFTSHLTKSFHVQLTQCVSDSLSAEDSAYITVVIAVLGDGRTEHEIDEIQNLLSLYFLFQIKKVHNQWISR